MFARSVILLASLSFSATVKEWDVVNDCDPATRKDVPIRLPDGSVGVGVYCTLMPHIKHTPKPVVPDTTNRR